MAFKILMYITMKAQWGRFSRTRNSVAFKILMYITMKAKPSTRIPDGPEFSFHPFGANALDHVMKAKDSQWPIVQFPP